MLRRLFSNSYKVKGIEMKLKIYKMPSKKYIYPTTSRYWWSSSSKRAIRKLILSYNQRHPIILPKHHVSKLIFEYHHRLLLHGGAQTLLTVIRFTYLPINGLALAKQTYRMCIKCVQVTPRPYTPYMGNLPSQRITPCWCWCPFTIVGIDYAGPYFAKKQLRRKIQPYKVHLALFIRFATKAVHLEMVPTSAFLAAFNRFSSRRGSPTEIHSDNGK